MLLKRVAMVVVAAARVLPQRHRRRVPPRRADRRRHKRPPRRRRRPGRASQATPARTSGESETRPATTTFEGDTGLWFVPTGEVLPAKKWSFSALPRELRS